MDSSPSGEKDEAFRTECELLAGLRKLSLRCEMDAPTSLGIGKEDPMESAAAAASATSPHHGAMGAEKRAVLGTEYELVAARLRRQRTRAPRVQAPASAIKPPPFAARNEAAHRNPNLSASTAASSGIIKDKPDHHGGAGGGGSVESYKRLSILGEGGSSTVWKARDTRTGELVAIKSGKGNDSAAALLSEAAMLAACRGNPAVVALREVVRGPAGTDDDVHIVMDFPGRSLRDLLDSRLRFTESETRGAMRQLLTGVDAMGNQQGIVHGDLKPENVLVGQRDDGCLLLLICDLGLAVSVTSLPCHIDGTLYYMAPEQLLGEKNCGRPVDAWALGCVMAELLTGKPLVQAYNHIEQWTQTIFFLGVPDEVTQMDFNMDASTPSELRDRVPQELLTPAGFDVLQGLLQYEQGKRLTPAEALQLPWFSQTL